MTGNKFNQITVESVIRAINLHEILSETELKSYGGKSRTYFVHYGTSYYPPKRLIRLVLNKTTHELAKIFDFNAVEAKNYLIKLGFTVDAEVDSPPKSRSSVNKSLNKKLSSIELSNEEFRAYEGRKYEVKLLRRSRSQEIVAQAKQKNKYTCEVCGFHFENRIVQAHHLVPVSQNKGIKLVSENDLIVLCPTCHYLAHYLLEKNPEYSERQKLVNALKDILKRIELERSEKQ